jgi:hypothetical protein
MQLHPVSAMVSTTTLPLENTNQIRSLLLVHAERMLSHFLLSLKSN